jgi:HEAT repeat protein
VGGLTLREATKAIETVVAKIVDQPKLRVMPSWRDTDVQRLELVNDSDAKKAPQVRIPREDLRYNGKSFDEWRRNLLTELKPEIRVDGIKAMAEFGANGYGEEAAEVILEIMRGIVFTYGELSENNVLGICRIAIHRIGPSAVPVLLKGLIDPKVNARRFAAASIPNIQPAPKEAQTSVIKATKDADATVRALALHAGAALDVESAPFIDALAAALGDKAPSVRSVAFDLVINHKLGFKMESAVPVLIDAIKVDDSERNPKGLAILTSLGPKARPAIPAIIELSKYPSRLDDVLTALKSIEPDKRKLAIALVQAAAREPGQWQFNSRLPTAANEIPKLGPEAKAAVPVLIEMLKSGDEAEQLTAAAILGKLGILAKDALPALQELKEKTKPSGLLNVVSNAIEAINRKD